MRNKRYIKFLSRKSIVSLIGIDYSILKEAGEENIHKFYFAGLLVLGTLVASFFSVFYAFELMFHMWYAEIFLASFFALMFFTIYVLLIQTFSKEVLPASHFQSLFNLSNAGRLGFVLMIGFIISQPIKIFLLKDTLDAGLVQYKNELLKDVSSRLSDLYGGEISSLQSTKKRQFQLYGNQDPAVKDTEQQIRTIQEKINREETDVKTKIFGSDFFVRRVLLASTDPYGWLITLATVTLFAIPVFLIYSISSNSSYYQIKKRKEYYLVNSDYQRFKKKYSQIFSSRFGIHGVRFYEPFIDAPFNTKRKLESDMLSMKEFKSKFLN